MNRMPSEMHRITFFDPSTTSSTNSSTPCTAISTTPDPYHAIEHASPKELRPSVEVAVGIVTSGKGIEVAIIGRRENTNAIWAGEQRVR
jgi:hypothetical protein